MKQTNYLFLVAASIAVITSCNDIDYKKTRSGLLYKIISGNSKDSLARSRDILKFNITTKLNDSLLYSSYGKMPSFFAVPELIEANYSPVEIFPLLRKGDSAIVVSVVDTLLLKKGEVQLPPGAKKGDRITTTFKVIEVFRDDSIARLDFNAETNKDLPRRQKEMQEQQVKAEKEMAGRKEKEDKEIQSYLDAKKITTQKTSKGTYVQLLSGGQGTKVDSGKYVSVKYKGSNFKGEIFDTNMDTAYHHPPLLSFTVGARQMVEGFDDGIMSLNKGAHAILYMPAALAFGPESRPPYIGPYENLIFEIYVIDVKDAPPAQQPVQTKPNKPKGKK
jgi:FKBP-type peptidyl-prolyl cis-trans isomerase